MWAIQNKKNNTQLPLQSLLISWQDYEVESRNTKQQVWIFF